MRADRGARRARDAEARLAQAREMSRRLAELEDALADYAAGAEKDASSPEERITCEIEPGLGVVEVDGNGELIDIRLDARLVGASNPAVLGERVLAALHRAEAEARSTTRERMRLLARALPLDHSR